MFIDTGEVVNQGSLHSPGQEIGLKGVVQYTAANSAKRADLFWHLEQSSGNSPDIRLDRRDRLAGIDHVNLVRRPSGLVQKTLPETLSIFVALTFHPIERATHSEVRAFNTHIEQEHTAGHQPTRCNLADLPNLLRIQA